MARLLVAPDQFVFLCESGELVGSVREQFGTFHWMAGFEDTDIVPAKEIIEWRDGRWMATTRANLQTLRDALASVEDWD